MGDKRNTTQSPPPAPLSCTHPAIRNGKASKAALWASFIKLYWLTHSQIVSLTLYFHLGTICTFKMPLVFCFSILFFFLTYRIPGQCLQVLLVWREGNTGILYYPWSSITQQLNKPEEKKRDLWTWGRMVLHKSAGGKSGTKWVQLGSCKVVKSRMPCRKDSSSTDRILRQLGVQAQLV